MHIAVIAHDIRSTHNVGSIFRSCDGFGVDHLYLTGYTPYPTVPNDSRLPHERDKLTKQISKSALGAEQTVAFTHTRDLEALIDTLKADAYYIIALEQHYDSVYLDKFHWFFEGKTPQKIALILGNEVDGVSESTMCQCDMNLEIRMSGKKESFNVSVAAGIALFELTRLVDETSK